MRYGPAPQTAKGKKHGAIEKEPDRQRPERPAPDHPADALREGDGFGFGLEMFGRRRPTEIRRPIAHHHPDQCGQYQGEGPHHHKRQAPADPDAEPGQRGGGNQRAQPADGHEDPRHDGELARSKPLGENLHRRHEEHGHADPDQGPADQGPGGRRRNPQESRTTGSDQKENGDGLPRPPGIREQAGRQLHDGIRVEVGCGEQPRERAAGLQVLHHVDCNDGRAQSMKVDEDVAAGENPENDPAVSAKFLLLGVAHVQIPLPVTGCLKTCTRPSAKACGVLESAAY